MAAREKLGAKRRGFLALARASFYPCLIMILNNKVALITGSGRGIGRSIARLFSKEGASVFLTARTEKELAAAAADVSAQGGRADFTVADLTRAEDCAAVVDHARKKFGAIDILVNNAGHYGPVVPVEDYPLEEFDKVIAVHLRATFLLTKLVLPHMYDRNDGVILNISSISAKAAFSWGSAYAAAKAGILGLTRVTAAEAARKGVRVNAICPGPVTETAMSKELGAELARKLGVSEEEQLAGFLNGLLQGRAQTAAEIARAALFLCSEHSSAMTGQALNVDGGVCFY
ncbi:MAG TPA: SDR family NAD(P)-dependent oxidoreductase [Candidatus Saccharimonadales bacterium]|nr:SDR family NAD(P)-dependent oxidoreductase [Candidatus Saccharimonadales bacterium]